jgi:glutamine synthetase
MSTPDGVLELAKRNGAKRVDIKFVDTFGTWQHFSIPMAEFSEEAFAEGPGFDGSSIRAWKRIEALESDHAFLLKGDVFSEDFLEMWVSSKRKEHNTLRLCPHPREFFL